MAEFSTTIPSCAVEFLFAEDLINRIMRRHTGGQFKARRAPPFREFVFNAFSDEIAEAVDFIDTMLEWEIDETFSRMVDERQVNREAFVDYARYFEELCFKQGFDADNFLNFCVRLVSLADYFTQYGETEAIEIALIFIIKVMSTYDLFEGGWDTLKAVAKKYVKRKKDFCEILTPDISDDESLMNALEDEEENDESSDLEQDGSFVIDQEEMPNEELGRQRLDFSGLDFSASFEAEKYIVNEEEKFTNFTEGKSQDKPDCKWMDLSDPKLDLPAISINETEGYISNGCDESSIAQEETSKDKADHERMVPSEPKLDLSATSENKTEGSLSSKYDESTITQDEEAQNEPDHQGKDLSDLEFHFPAAFESEVKLCASKVDNEYSITQAEMPQDIPNDEKVYLSGFEVEQPVCSDTMEKIKIGIFPSDM